MVRCRLFRPVSARLLALADTMAPLQSTGCSFGADLAQRLSRQLLEMAQDAQVLEAAAWWPEDQASRRLFALAGLLEKHSTTGCMLHAEDVALFRRALQIAASLLISVERALECHGAKLVADQGQSASAELAAGAAPIGAVDRLRKPH